MPHSHHFTNLKIEKLPNSEAQITGEINLPFLVECREKAIKYLKTNTRIDGFREGHVPDEVLVKHLTETRILQEAAEVAMADQYPHIIEEAKLNVISRPHIGITKLAPGIPLEFNIRVLVEPEFDLPDYKKIAGGIKEEDREKRRIMILEELEKATTIDLPEPLKEMKLHFILSKIAKTEKLSNYEEVFKLLEGEKKAEEVK